MLMNMRFLRNDVNHLDAEEVCRDWGVFQSLISLTANRYNNELQTSELFSTAGRAVKSGLVASAVVSSWTWAATLLTSSGVAYRYGVSGPLWVGTS